MKNTLATVQSLAAHSLRDLGAGAAAGRAAFEARIFALSRAHDVLTQESWSGADMRGIAGEALRPFLAPDAPARIALNGPDLRLPPETALALTMILHELATNAVKHGALSRPGGGVALQWRVEPDAPDRMRLTWCERGGPPVAPPSRTGFGTRLLERGLAGRGTARLAYDPEGFSYEATASLPGASAALPAPR